MSYYLAAPLISPLAMASTNQPGPTDRDEDGRVQPHDDIGVIGRGEHQALIRAFPVILDSVAVNVCGILG